MYTMEGKVRYSEADADGNLTLVGLVNYLQDACAFQLEDAGAGVKFMFDHEAAWFISAWQIHIDRLPRFNEAITVNTWCYEMGRLEAKRNYTICDAAGNACVRADSLWFVYDFASQRPIRLPDYVQGTLDLEPPLDLPPTKRKLRVEGEGVATQPLEVGLHHLDSNRHVNNAQYILMAVDALNELTGTTAEQPSTPFDEKPAAKPAIPHTICVQYKQMALLGDTVCPHVHLTDTAATVSLDSPDGTTYAVVSLA